MLGLIFTYGMAYGGAAVAIAYPYVGFLIYVSFAILKPGDGCWEWSVPPGNYSKVLALGILIGWAIRGCGDWRFGKAWSIVLLLMGYLLWNVFASLEAINQNVAWGTVEHQTKIAMLVLVGLTLIDSLEHLRQLAWVILLSFGWVAYEMNMSYFSGYNRLRETGFAGLDNNAAAITLVSAAGLGIFLSFGASRLWQRAVAAGCTGLLVHAVLFSFSRGGMIGLILVVGCSFLLIPKRPVHFVALITGAVLAVSVVGPEVTARFETSFAEGAERDDSASSRLVLWTICFEECQKVPFFGYGPAHFAIHAHEFGLKAGKEAHTTWLSLAVDLGIPGAIFFLGFFVVPVVLMRSLARQSSAVPDPFFRDIARMVIASNVGFIFTAQFVTVTAVEGPFFVVLLAAGALKIYSSLLPLAATSPAARKVDHS